MVQLLVLNIRNQTLPLFWLHYPFSSRGLASISSLFELFLRYEHTACCVSDLLPSCIIELLLMSSCQDLFAKSYFWPGEKRWIWKRIHQPFFLRAGAINTPFSSSSACTSHSSWINQESVSSHTATERKRPNNLLCKLLPNSVWLAYLTVCGVCRGSKHWPQQPKAPWRLQLVLQQQALSNNPHVGKWIIQSRRMHKVEHQLPSPDLFALREGSKCDNNSPGMCH